MDSVLFIDYATTVKLLSVADTMAICEDIFRMHARKTVQWSNPPSQRLDVGAPFHNHWHVKEVILEDTPVTGCRLYSYYDDGVTNTVGKLDCARYIVLADPRTGHPLCILDEHWTYAIRSAAAAMVALKWLGPKAPRTLGLVGIGTMGENCLRCLQHLYTFGEIVCTSRRKETREAFAQKWSAKTRHPGAHARQRRSGGAQRRSRDRRHHPHRHRQPRAVGETRRDVRVARAPRDGPGRLGECSTRS